MPNKGKSKLGDTGTVLLVEAKPKYSFQGKKLPKEPTPPRESDEHHNNLSIQTPRHQQNVIGATSKTAPHHQGFGASTTTGKPIAVVGASCQAFSQNTENDEAKRKVLSLLSSPLNSAVSMPNLAETTHNLSKDMTVTGHDHAGRRTGRNLPSQFGSHQSSAGHFTTQPNLQHFSDLNLNKETDPTYEPEDDNLVELAASSVIASQVLQSANQHHEHVRHLEQERDRARQDLEVQLQVNKELKKLLVASVGEDLGQRVEILTRDRAQLSVDLGGFSKKMSEDYENFDRVSIQADMWRSKYLASRVMVEELANARAYYSLQTHDSQEALQQLLNERHELRTNLKEAYKVLYQVKHAFDPLNSQHRGRHHLLAGSSNVLQLTRACQHLAEAVRFRLLPAHIAVPLQDGVEGAGLDDSWENSVTRAEQYAHEVLSRPSEPTGSLVSGHSNLLPLNSCTPSSPQAGRKVCRYHPNTRHENLTFSCCVRCKGEINVI